MRARYPAGVTLRVIPVGAQRDQGISSSDHPGIDLGADQGAEITVVVNGETTWFRRLMASAAVPPGLSK
jgi:hypothetical protein